MKSICFAGLCSETNLGDLVILESTKYLYKDVLKEEDNITFEHLDLLYKNKSLFKRIVRKVMKMFDGFHLVNNTVFELNLLKKYYKNQINDADLIVVVGGGLIKYKYQSFHMYLTALIEVAEELNIPLVINAAGVEGYDEEDARCQLLKNSLNKKIVKSITTRDDIETLVQYYISNSQTHTDKVADSAVYCNEAYRATKKHSDIFGIGLVRGGIFLDNERDFQPDDIAKLYADLIQEMEFRGLNYQLFTNGLSLDSELVEKIESQLGNKKLVLIEPKDDKDLIEIIASFTTVIAARLHANIISYSLGVPSVGLVWNDKLALFGKDIGYPERFFEYDQLNASSIVDAAVLANKQGYDDKARLEYRQTAKKTVNNIAKQFVKGEL